MTRTGSSPHPCPERGGSRAAVCVVNECMHYVCICVPVIGLVYPAPDCDVCTCCFTMCAFRLVYDEPPLERTRAVTGSLSLLSTMVAASKFFAKQFEAGHTPQRISACSCFPDFYLACFYVLGFGSFFFASLYHVD